MPQLLDLQARTAPADPAIPVDGDPYVPYSLEVLHPAGMSGVGSSNGPEIAGPMEFADLPSREDS